MGMNVGQDESDEVIANINTTPLVDVMLVLLIIFLITIPVVTHDPAAVAEGGRAAAADDAESVEIAVNRDGDFFWGEQLVDASTLLAKLKGVSAATAAERARAGRPEHALRVHQRVVTMCEQAGIAKVSFITEPPARWLALQGTACAPIPIDGDAWDRSEHRQEQTWE
jgi:biopolymer transport protein ExbD